MLQFKPSDKNVNNEIEQNFVKNNEEILKNKKPLFLNETNF